MTTEIREYNRGTGKHQRLCDLLLERDDIRSLCTWHDKEARKNFKLKSAHDFANRGSLCQDLYYGEFDLSPEEIMEKESDAFKSALKNVISEVIIEDHKIVGFKIIPWMHN